MMGGGGGPPRHPERFWESHSALVQQLMRANCRHAFKLALRLPSKVTSVGGHEMQQGGAAVAVAAGAPCQGLCL